MGYECFVFGESPPKWFLDKVKSQDVEYIFKDHAVIGCRYYSTKGNEIIRYKGDIVSSNSLYK